MISRGPRFFVFQLLYGLAVGAIIVWALRVLGVA